MSLYVLHYAGNMLGQDWGTQVPAPLSAKGSGSSAQPKDGVLKTKKPFRADAPVPKPVVKTPVAAAPLPSLDAELQTVLDRTNKYRANHGAAELAWDPNLAAEAAAYVNSCPMGHSGVQGRGENLAWGFTDFGSAVDQWYAEVGASSGVNQLSGSICNHAV